MKIRVVSQNWYRQYYYNSGTVPVYEQPDSPFWKINSFIRIDPAHGLFINCAAGISRSGAVGEVLNDYFNRYSENNEADREYFRNHNRQICGNPLVRRILRNVLFGPTFY